jgi:hypothetical protein
MSLLGSFRSRLGMPQLVAALLLLAFVAQCAWLAARVPLTQVEAGFLAPADAQHEGVTAGTAAAPSIHSPLTVTAACALARLNKDDAVSPWVARLPFLLMGLLLGASVWYVARRLYGNAGGYVALALYAFSPAMIMRSATVQPEIGAAWGAFGCVFTGIAVAHTLYAPREVVLWNWRRIVLLGIAIAVGVASQFAVVAILALTLALMLYLVPHRRGAALIIFAAACGVGLALLWAITGFNLGALWTTARNSGLGAFHPALFLSPLVGRLLLVFLVRESPGMLLLLAIALVAFFTWPRARFFGTAAPLAVATILVILAIGLPHAAGLSFLAVALPFAFVFVAGVFADLLETRSRTLALGAVTGVLLAHALSSVVSLAVLVG